MVEVTYNTLQFHLCNAPQFLQLTDVQVKEHGTVNYDNSIQTVMLDRSFTSGPFDRQRKRQKRHLQSQLSLSMQNETAVSSSSSNNNQSNITVAKKNHTTVRKTLEFQLTTECRWNCKELTSIFAAIPTPTILEQQQQQLQVNNTTTTTNDTASTNNTTLVLPLDWLPPSYTDLQGPLLRQTVDNQDTDKCYCAATATTTAAATTTTNTQDQNENNEQPVLAELTPALFQLALQETLEGLHDQGVLQPMDTIVSLTEVQDQKCTMQPTKFNATIVVRVEKPFPRTVGKPNNGTTTTTPTSLVDDPMSLGRKIQNVYNSLTFSFCDTKHRRIRDIQINRQETTSQQVTFHVNAECHGCDPQDLKQQGHLLFFLPTNDTEREIVVNNSQVTQETVVVPVPEESCICPVSSSSSPILLDRLERAPTEEEVTMLVNQLVKQEEYDEIVSDMVQVDEYDCDVSTAEEKLIYTNVVVNFDGRPDQLTQVQAKILEETFKRTYNSLSFETCDATFRTVVTAKLFILPKPLIDGEDRGSSNGGSAAAVGDGTATRRRLQEEPDYLDFFDGNSTAGFDNTSTLLLGNETWWNGTNANVTKFNVTSSETVTVSTNTTIENTLPSLDLEEFPSTTTVFRVGVECRRCENTDTRTFGLFDSFERRRMKDIFVGAIARQLQVHSKAIAHTGGPACYCPIGTVPDSSFGSTNALLTQEYFEEVFSLNIEKLVQEENITAVNAVERLEIDDDICNGDELIEEDELIYSIDFEGQDVGQFTDDDFSTAFMNTVDQVRESECSPWVRAVHNVQLTAVGGDGLRRTLHEARILQFTGFRIRATFFFTSQGAGLAFLEFLRSKVDRLRFLIVQELLLSARHTNSAAPNAAVGGGNAAPNAAVVAFPISAIVVTPVTSPAPSISGSIFVKLPTRPPAIPLDPETSPSAFPPSGRPTNKPTPDPTFPPTPRPTKRPTLTPTPRPTVRPTRRPTFNPTPQPTPLSTLQPTPQPTRLPTPFPTLAPTARPPSDSFNTQFPSLAPSNHPGVTDSLRPSVEPIGMPSGSPSSTTLASSLPSSMPSFAPSELAMPSLKPSMVPALPSQGPSAVPSDSPAPSTAPSISPSVTPSTAPSSKPSLSPSMVPSLSALPSQGPSAVPSDSPAPSTAPSISPSATPSTTPSSKPSLSPSMVPSLSALPSQGPSAIPSDSPAPSTAPSIAPSSKPSLNPSTSPSSMPSTSATVTSFQLVDASVPIGSSGPNLPMTLDGGTTYDLADFPEDLSIRAIVDDTSNVNEVIFYVDGEMVVGDGQQNSPYSLAGDDGFNYFSSSRLKEIGSITIRAVPYKGGEGPSSDIDTDFPGQEGIALEMTFTLTHSGRVTVNDSPLLKELTPFDQTKTSLMAYYYGTATPSCSRANTPDNIEVGNSNTVALSILKDGNGIYILIIYDEPPTDDCTIQDLRIGGKVRATFSGDDISEKFQFSDNIAEAGTFSSGYLEHAWSYSTTDGFGLGPFPQPTKVCIQFTVLLGPIDGVFFVENDGGTRHSIASSTDLANGDVICITTPAVV